MLCDSRYSIGADINLTKLTGYLKISLILMQHSQSIKIRKQLVDLWCGNTRVHIITIYLVRPITTKRYAPDISHDSRLCPKGQTDSSITPRSLSLGRFGDVQLYSRYKMKKSSGTFSPIAWHTLGSTLMTTVRAIFTTVAEWSIYI